MPSGHRTVPDGCFGTDLTHKLVILYVFYRKLVCSTVPFAERLDIYVLPGSNLIMQILEIERIGGRLDILGLKCDPFHV